jgi:hypothetical protein
VSAPTSLSVRRQSALPRQRNDNSRRHVRQSMNDIQIVSPSLEAKRINNLRDLAAAGRLAEVAAGVNGRRRQELASAAFSIAWPVVFDRLTKGLERGRGHTLCASSVFRMAEDCRDRFYDDVEAVMDDVLTHAKTPIRNVEAWIAGRLNAACVDGHRRRRGHVGALQRPRLPLWLCQALDHDQWMMELAKQILVWVGVPATAGLQVWPADAWAARRATITDDYLHSDAPTVAREIETVLAVMRRRMLWYQTYVERPLGHKRPPVIGITDGVDLPALMLTNADDLDDARLGALAGEALRVIEARLSAGQNAHAVVIEVIDAVFGDGVGSEHIGCRPLDATDYGEHAAMALHDPSRVNRIVAAVLFIMAESMAHTTG